jgi:hypothetical protein
LRGRLESNPARQQGRKERTGEGEGGKVGGKKRLAKNRKGQGKERKGKKRRR